MSNKQPTVAPEDLHELHQHISAGVTEGYIPIDSSLHKAASSILQLSNLAPESIKQNKEQQNNTELPPECAKLYENSIMNIDQESKLYLASTTERKIRSALRSLRNKDTAGIDLVALAKELITLGYGKDVVVNLEIFTELDQNWLAIEVLENRIPDITIQNYIWKFNSLNTVTAKKIIEKGLSILIAAETQCFIDLDPEIAYEFITTNDPDFLNILFNLQVFKNLDYKKVALLLIKLNRIAMLLDFIGSFDEEAADLEVANLIYETSPLDHDQLANSIHHFSGLDQDFFIKFLKDVSEDEPTYHSTLFRCAYNLGFTNNRLAEAIIGTYAFDTLVENLDRFSGLSQKVAEECIFRGYGREFLESRDSFENLDSNKIAKGLVVRGPANLFMLNISRFPNIDMQKLEYELINTGNIHLLISNVDLFTNIVLDQTYAENLIHMGMGEGVLRDIDKFEGIDLAELYNLLVGTNQTDAIILNIALFPDADHEFLANSALDNAKSFERGVVEHNLHHLSGLSLETANKLADVGFAAKVIESFSSFKGIDEYAFVMNLIYNLAYNVSPEDLGIELYAGLDVAMAQELIDKDHKSFVARYYNKFSGLTADIYKQLVAGDNGDIADILLETVEHDLAEYVYDIPALYEVFMAGATVYSTAQKVKKLLFFINDEHEYLTDQQVEEIRAVIAATPKPEVPDGVKQENPYQPKDTYQTGGPAKVKKAREISKLLKNVEQDGTEQAEKLQELNNVIEEQYIELKEEVIRLIGPAKANLIFAEHTEAGQSPLRHRYKLLVCEYLAGEVLEEDEAVETVDFIKDLNISLTFALSHANEKFLQVLEVDVPYYDKLFLEWDTKRIGEKEFTEVFLGRDGIYAFIGRQAQINARRKKVGVNSDQNGPVGKKPEYLVYPRGFRDGLSEELKAQYLDDKLGDNAASASFYDTGFVGTIPQDIMSVLGISADEIENKIRLLSATRRERTVIGLKADRNERTAIVHKVEGNVKAENSAEGLYSKKPVNPGIEAVRKLESYAVPTDPSEQLAFGLVEQALRRYYFSQETMEMDFGYRIDKLPSGVEIRVKTGTPPETKKTIEDIFSSGDIGESLKTAVTKIDVGGEAYPDEVIFEIGNIIVKQYVAKKQQGTIDEFEALNLLEKIGIDAPRPIARTFTGSGQSGFVVMEKLQGVSGRDLEKHVPESAIDNFKYLAYEKMREVAKAVRRDAGIDKPWRLEDFMFEYTITETTGEIDITRMVPIDFEQVQIFDPNNPCVIEGETYEYHSGGEDDYDFEAPEE